MVDELLLYPFRLMRKKIIVAAIPAISIVVLLAFLVLVNGVKEPEPLLNATDYYLGETVYLSGANLVSFNNMSTNVQIPLIRLGIMAEKARIQELAGPDPKNFIFVFTILWLGFISYAMVANSVYKIESGMGSPRGFAGINAASIILAASAAFFMLFVSSFSLGGFKLFLIISFGTYFTFSIPYAASGQPLGESIFRGFRFMSKLGRIVESYIGCMGAAIMVPIALMIFTAPIIMNMESQELTTLLKLVLGLFAVVFALFYQMALCAAAVFHEDINLGETSSHPRSSGTLPQASPSQSDTSQ